MVTVFTKCTMSTTNGQFVLYKKLKNSWKMCTDDQQNPKENALMYKFEREKDGKIQMALRFQDNKLYYSPEEAGGELKMKKTSSDPNSLSDNYWFEKVNLGAGEYHGLRTVSKPQLYLCLKEREISTTGDSAKSLHVRVEKI